MTARYDLTPVEKRMIATLTTDIHETEQLILDKTLELAIRRGEILGALRILAVQHDLIVFGDESLSLSEDHSSLIVTAHE